MPRDMQYGILELIRQTGFTGSGVLVLSRNDAQQLIASIPDLEAASTTPEGIDEYEGTRDATGVITYRLDEELQSGTAQLDRDDGVRIPVILHGI